MKPVLPIGAAALRKGDTSFRPAPLLAPQLPAHVSGSPTYPDEYETYLTSYRLYCQALHALREEFWSEARLAPEQGRKSYAFVKRPAVSRVITERLFTTGLQLSTGSVSYLSDLEFGTFSNSPCFPLCFADRAEAQVQCTAFSEGPRPSFNGKILVVEVNRAVRAYDSDQLRFGVEPVYKDGARVRYGGRSTVPSPPSPPTAEKLAEHKKRRAAARRRQRAAKRSRQRLAKAASLGEQISVTKAQGELVKAQSQALVAADKFTVVISKRARQRAKAKAKANAKAPRKGKAGPPTPAVQPTTPEKSTPVQEFVAAPPPNRAERRRAIYGSSGQHIGYSTK